MNSPRLCMVIVTITMIWIIDSATSVRQNFIRNRRMPGNINLKFRHEPNPLKIRIGLDISFPGSRSTSNAIDEHDAGSDEQTFDSNTDQLLKEIEADNDQEISQANEPEDEENAGYKLIQRINERIKLRRTQNEIVNLNQLYADSRDDEYTGNRNDQNSNENIPRVRNTSRVDDNAAFGSGRNRNDVDDNQLGHFNREANREVDDNDGRHIRPSNDDKDSNVSG